MAGAIAAGVVSLALSPVAVSNPANLAGGDPLNAAGAGLTPATTSPTPTSGESPTSTSTSTTTTPPSTTTSTTPSSSPPPTSSRPTITQPPPPKPPADDSQQARVVQLVNQERARAGCRAVTVDDRLTRAAQGHSTDMATRDYFSHTSPDGSTFVDRAKAEGYPSPGAENIAMGYRSAEDVMRGWMNSDGHRRNILTCELVAIGVGLDTRGWYWTQVFGR